MIDWHAIVRKHGPIVWQTAYRLVGNHIDAAESFGETFAFALEVSQRQRVRNFPALLVRLATSRAIDALRQRFSRSQSVDAVDVVTLPGNGQGPVQQAQAHELAAKLRKALAQLPPKEAEVFCLRYLSDMSYRQIGRELGIRANTAVVLLHRARVKLRDIIELPPD